jgi:hypothetical protein
MEQAPGPRGSPHDPQGPLGLAEAADSWDFSPRTAKLESCWLSRLLSHLGHAAFCVPRTIASNWWRHCWQTYSKIGMLDGSGKIVKALIIIGQPKALTTKDTKKHEGGRIAVIAVIGKAKAYR